jgi:hypothetical protein
MRNSKFKKILLVLPYLFLILGVWIIADRLDGNFEILFSIPLWKWSITIVLGIIGIAIESQIWHLAAIKIGAVSWLSSVRNTLRFQYYKLFVPSGIGEFGARMTHFPGTFSRRASGEYTALIQVLKWLGRILLAAIGLLFWTDSPLPNTYRWILSASLLALPWISFLILKKRIPLHYLIPQKTRERVKGWLPHLTKGDFPVGTTFSWIVVRIVLYSSTLTLLMTPGWPEASLFFSILFASWSYYFLASFLPNLGIAEGLIRAGAGVLYFSQLGIDEWAVVNATLVIWFINTALPGIAGGIDHLKHQR